MSKMDGDVEICSSETEKYSWFEKYIAIYTYRHI